MDMSKLPKFSQTPAPPPPEQPMMDQANPGPLSAPAQAAPAVAARPGNGPEAWISIGIGVILLLITPNTLAYFSSKIFHTKFEPFVDPTRPFPAKCDFIMYTDGTKIFYRDMTAFWSDLAVTAFALTLILDGFVMRAWPAVYSEMSKRGITTKAQRHKESQRKRH